MPEELWAKVPESVIRDATLSSTAFRLYAFIDLRAGKRGHWYGTQKHIAEQLGISERWLRSATAELVAGGYIEAKREYRRILYVVRARTGTPLPVTQASNRNSTSGRTGTPLPVTQKRTSFKIHRPNHRPSVITSTTDWDAVIKRHQEKAGA